MNLGRIRSFLALIVVGLLATSITAVSYIAFEQVTVADTVIGFTSTAITAAGLPQATLASCRLETAQVRWTINGTTPTTTVGTPLEIGDTLTITGHDLLVRFRAIRTGGTSGVLSCHYSAP